MLLQSKETFLKIQIQQILNKTKQAEEPTDQPAEYDSEEQQDTSHTGRKPEPALAKLRLQGTYRAGTDCPGAGVAVQSRNTRLLRGTLIYTSGKKSLDIQISKQCGSCLYYMPLHLSYLHMITRFLYIPDKH